MATGDNGRESESMRNALLQIRPAQGGSEGLLITLVTLATSMLLSSGAAAPLAQGRTRRRDAASWLSEASRLLFCGLPWNSAAKLDGACQPPLAWRLAGAAQRAPSRAPPRAPPRADVLRLVRANRGRT